MSRPFWRCLLILFLLSLTACGAPAMESAPAADEVSAVEEEAEAAPAAEEPAAEGEAVAATATPLPQPTALPTPTAIVEPRLVEIEWPSRLHLGDSDVIRMALIPTQNGYTLTTEFSDHQTSSQDVPIVRPAGYELYGIGRLNGVGFTLAPEADQIRLLPLDETVIWHWSLTPQQPGRQRVTITLLLRWEPLEEISGKRREAVAYSKGLEIQVDSFFGLTRGQSLTAGLFSGLLGGGASLFALITRPGGRTAPKKRLPASKPNPNLLIEAPPNLTLTPTDRGLLQVLFQRYARIIIQTEFLSGYSGARTFLLRPLHTDGRADADTIAKIGPQAGIWQEFENYETFVKHTLPPITARIQNQPVRLSKNSQTAALQYTFIGQSGQTPISLRQVLQNDPNPSLLNRLFETFGPNWWMQRSPYSFRIAEEYDALLPPHYVVEPISVARSKKWPLLDGRLAPGDRQFQASEIVWLKNFPSHECRPDRNYTTLRGAANPGQPRLRLHWQAASLPKAAFGQIVATRQDTLQKITASFNLFGLPDPLAQLDSILNQTVQGTRTTIHGDLNLENILIGPEGFVWLIDFATTRQGHPLADFAHLETEIIAHIIAPQIENPAKYAAWLQGETAEFAQFQNLRQTLQEIAANCLANPNRPEEYQLVLYLNCLGALKYANLNPHQKQCLYLTAANIVKNLPFSTFIPRK